MEYLEVPSSAVSLVAYSFLGLSCLSFLYGVFGFILAVLKFLRLGPRRFFRRVARPAPPPKALDPIHGTHEMIKLKVRSIPQVHLHRTRQLRSSRRASPFITCPKACRISR